jgi:hypothetical protein
MPHRITKCLTVLFALMTLLQAVPQSRAQDNPYVSWGQGQIADLRPKMRANMTAPDAMLEQSVKYTVVDTGILNAFAVPPQANQGRREIRISSAMFETIDNFATMTTISFLWNSPKCSSAYGDYIHDLYDSNSISVSEGLRAKPTDPPFLFVKHHSDICPHISPDVILQNDRSSGGVRTVLIEQSIEWMLLHEFAHHLNNDFGRVSLPESRQRESRADNYATQTMLVSPEDSPLAAVPMIEMLCTVENFNSADTKSDHPAGVRRLKAMFDAAQGSEQWHKMWKMASPTQRQQIQATLDELGQMQ